MMWGKKLLQRVVLWRTFRRYPHTFIHENAFLILISSLLKLHASAFLFDFHPLFCIFHVNLFFLLLIVFILQSVELDRLAVYLDSDVCPWNVVKLWKDMLPSEWSMVCGSL